MPSVCLAVFTSWPKNSSLKFKSFLVRKRFNHLFITSAFSRVTLSPAQQLVVVKAATVCKYLHNVPKTRGKQLSLICITSHQAKLVEVCEQPPGVDVIQAVGRLQVRECRRKHLNATKKSEKERERERERERIDYYQDICCASIKFLMRRCEE